MIAMQDVLELLENFPPVVDYDKTHSSFCQGPQDLPKVLLQVYTGSVKPCSHSKLFFEGILTMKEMLSITFFLIFNDAGCIRNFKPHKSFQYLFCRSDAEKSEGKKFYMFNFSYHSWLVALTMESHTFEQSVF